MYTPSIEIILNYVFGSTTLVAIWIAWKSRNSELKTKEASALESIDSIYNKMSASMDKEFEKMQKTIDKQTAEIDKLKKTVNEYASKCANCQLK